MDSVEVYWEWKDLKTSVSRNDTAIDIDKWRKALLNLLKEPDKLRYYKRDRIEKLLSFLKSKEENS